MRSTALLLWTLAVVPIAAADERCIFDGSFYASGSVRCNEAGSQERCVGGSWKPLGLDCADEGAGAPGIPEDPGVPRDAVDAPPRAIMPPVREPAVREP